MREGAPGRGAMRSGSWSSPDIQRCARELVEWAAEHAPGCAVPSEAELTGELIGIVKTWRRARNGTRDETSTP